MKAEGVKVKIIYAPQLNFFIKIITISELHFYEINKKTSNYY